MKDIARLAGVSLGTVSRVLNGADNVKDFNARRVWEVVEQLGYRPSPAARSLASKKKENLIIGVLLPHLTHPFYFDILKGIQGHLEEMGHNLLVFNLGNQPAKTLERILSESLDGLLVVSYLLSTKMQENFQRMRIPLVYVDKKSPVVPWAAIDNFAGGQLAARHLISQGVKKAVYIGESAETEQQSDRRQGFIEEYESQGLERPLEFYTQQGEETSFRLTNLVWKDNHPQGLFYFCDEMAYGGLKFIKKIPNPPLIVGYDDLLPSRYLGLTTIRQPAVEMGSNGTRLLLDQMERKDVANILLNPTLVKRKLEI